jgi:hypothetical protein
MHMQVGGLKNMMQLSAAQESTTSALLEQCAKAEQHACLPHTAYFLPHVNTLHFTGSTVEFAAAISTSM